MQIFTMVAGILCMLAVCSMPFRRSFCRVVPFGRFRLTRIFFIVTWKPWAFFVRRLRDPRIRESAYSYYGPMSLIFLLACGPLEW